MVMRAASNCDFCRLFPVYSFISAHLMQADHRLWQGSPKGPQGGGPQGAAESWVVKRVKRESWGGGAEEPVALPRRAPQHNASWPSPCSPLTPSATCRSRIASPSSTRAARCDADSSHLPAPMSRHRLAAGAAAHRHSHAGDGRVHLGGRQGRAALQDQDARRPPQVRR